MKKNTKNKGVVIFVALALLFLLSSIALAILLTAYNYNNICESQIRRQKAIASTEAGINYAYWQLRTNLADFTNDHYSEATADTITLGSNGMSAKVWVTGPISGRYTVRSKVTYSKTQAI